MTDQDQVKSLMRVIRWRTCLSCATTCKPPLLGRSETSFAILRMIDAPDTDLLSGQQRKLTPQVRIS